MPPDWPVFCYVHSLSHREICCATVEYAAAKYVAIIANLKWGNPRYVIDDRTELSQVLMELHEDGTPKAFYVYGHGLIGREDEAGNTWAITAIFEEARRC